MTRIVFLAALMLVLAGCGSDNTRSADPEIRKLVDRVLEAAGGEEAMREVDGYLAVGKLHAKHRNVLIRTRRWVKRPDCLLLELDYPGQPEWRLTLGELAWKGGSAETLKPATGAVVHSMRLQTARFDLPVRLRDVERAMILLEDDEEGRRVLSHDWGDGHVMEYHIDRESHHITHMAMHMDGPPAMTFAADYDDFRPVGGVMMPHREVTLAGPTVTSKVVLDTFILNPADLDEILEAPDSGMVMLIQ